MDQKVHDISLSIIQMIESGLNAMLECEFYPWSSIAHTLFLVQLI